MKRYTTFKLENIACNDDQAVANSIETSESILDQSYTKIPYITDNFVAIPMQTVAHSWISAEEHACKILFQITKSDYELISFKKKQLDDKLSYKAFLQF